MFLKINNSLLRDKEYSNIVKDTINEVLSLHIKETNNNNNINNINNSYNNNKNDYDNKEFIINHQLLLEIILMMIRGETINFGAYRKRKQTKEEKNG